MEKVYLLLGGNIGNKLDIFTKTLNNIQIEIGQLIKKSSIFETEPWGFKHENNFWNQVVIVETNLNPNDVFAKIQKIEKSLGRVRTTDQYSERIIDIDILFYNSLTINTRQLTIPHPRIQERMFTLAPLNEIDKDMIHPVLNKTIAVLKSECIDKLKVERITPNQR